MLKKHSNIFNPLHPLLLHSKQREKSHALRTRISRRNGHLRRSVKNCLACPKNILPMHTKHALRKLVILKFSFFTLSNSFSFTETFWSFNNIAFHYEAALRLRNEICITYQDPESVKSQKTDFLCWKII